MTGHAEKRGQASWRLKFEIGSDPVTGKRRMRRVAFKCKTKRKAELELTRLVAEYHAGLAIDPLKLTLADFLERWDRDHAALNCTPKTRERYRQIIKNQITPHIGSVSI